MNGRTNVWYVVEKDVENNVVFVSRNYFSVDKRRRVFRAGSLRWFGGSPPRPRRRIRCKVRHGPGFYDCDMNVEGETAVVKLVEDDQGLAAGQYAAFYHESTCLGSGVIFDSWDDGGYPIAAKALDIAKLLRDKKVKLGKPVKIRNMETTTR
ncbi:hypothetical protein M569_06524 [Genlisea aurea]|uniref:tRNA-specific 2-thiouridylase MnmA-like C-terminal domain-containing protein n=1 Tax=Genlisea aurea TaxID=192259 RepID=S8E752_9LAMI|nr:hypothetical protein M569_06524 [Genlisea aurea]